MQKAGSKDVKNANGGDVHFVGKFHYPVPQVCRCREVQRTNDEMIVLDKRKEMWDRNYKMLTDFYIS